MALLAQTARTYAYGVVWNGIKGMMTRVAQHLDLEERKRWNSYRYNVIERPCPWNDFRVAACYGNAGMESFAIG
jgi:hypothetical protein